MWIINDISQAIPHCIKAIPNAAFLEPSSLFIQAIAATQGVYNNVNIKKTNAALYKNGGVRE